MKPIMATVFSRYRDFLFLGLLIFMVNVALKRQHHSSVLVYAPADQVVENAKAPAEESLSAQIDSIMKQIDEAFPTVPLAPSEVSQLHAIHHQLSQLKKECQFSNPAYILLGPIGSAGIALKEQKVEKEVIKAAEKIGRIIAQAYNIEWNENSRDLSEHIAYNSHLLQKTT